MSVGKMAIQGVHFYFHSDSSVCVEFEGELSKANEKVIHLFQKLLPWLNQERVLNLHPAYRNLLIDFDPLKVYPMNLQQEVVAVVKDLEGVNFQAGPIKEIPVEYGGEAGPDLVEISKTLKIDPEKIIELHSKAEYKVAFLGFSPGFPYLMGLPSELQTPRKNTPRIRVPAGSVAIAGKQAGIYPQESPGGWNLIGRSGINLFDFKSDPPSFLNPGDRVRFRKISAIEKSEIKSSSVANDKSKALLRVEEGGFLSSLQDRGRWGYSHWGVSAGGAADLLAYRMGQKLVGNSDEASAIEMTAHGGVFTFLKNTWVALTGANCSPLLDGQNLSMWTSVPVSAGQRLVIRAHESNLRSYLTVHGGFNVPKILRSQSTAVNAGFGGYEGRSLKSGDHLLEGVHFAEAPTYRKCRPTILELYNKKNRVLRVTRGPQWDWFSEEALKALLESEFEVTQDINRLGLRLRGPSLSLKNEFKNTEMESEGIANGAIQVPSSGQAMILFCEQRTTGGYPKIANIIRADEFLLGQLTPGEKIRFAEVDIEEAWRLHQELEKLIESGVYEF